MPKTNYKKCNCTQIGNYNFKCVGRATETGRCKEHQKRYEMLQKQKVEEDAQLENTQRRTD